MKQELIRDLRGMRVVKYGKFERRGGDEANHYIEMSDVHGYLGQLEKLADVVWDYVESDEIITGVASMGHGGIPLAIALGMRHSLTRTLIRDKPKSYGTKSFIDGYKPGKRDKLILVDGVSSTGWTFEHMIKALGPTKAKILECCCIVAQGEAKDKKEILDIPFTYILTDEDLL